MIERYILYFPFVLALGLMATLAAAQDRQIVVASEIDVAQTGLWSYVLPRFSLKTGISVTLVVAGDTPEATLATDHAIDVYILNGPQVAEALVVDGTGTEWRGVMASGNPSGDFVALLINPSSGADTTQPHAERFMDWLVSDIGQRTIESFRQNDTQVFFSWATETEAPPVEQITGDPQLGEELALTHCGRCHVISERNKYGGIDSTPSFAGLRTIADWRQRFEVFWTLNPHPSFTQIKGVTEPFDPAFPPPIAPLYLSVGDVENIGAFLATIKPKDLGPPLQSN